VIMSPPRLNRGRILKSLETDLRPRIESKFRGILRWLSPREAQTLGGFPGVAFVLCASPGYMFVDMPSLTGNLLAPAEPFRGMHGYCPDESGMESAFIANGPRIRSLGAIERIMDDRCRTNRGCNA